MIAKIQNQNAKKTTTTMKKKNDKSAENESSNIKFANMTNIKSSKYANMSIKKTSNNLL
jgi:hypothetical protein